MNRRMFLTSAVSVATLPAVATAQEERTENEGLSVNLTARETATVGESERFEVRITTTDDFAGGETTVVVTLHANGEELEKMVEIGRGDEQNVTFQHTFGEAGTFDIRAVAEYERDERPRASDDTATIQVNNQDERSTRESDGDYEDVPEEEPSELDECLEQAEESWWPPTKIGCRRKHQENWLRNLLSNLFGN